MQMIILLVLGLGGLYLYSKSSAANTNAQNQLNRQLASNQQTGQLLNAGTSALNSGINAANNQAGQVASQQTGSQRQASSAQTTATTDPTSANQDTSSDDSLVDQATLNEGSTPDAGDATAATNDGSDGGGDSSD
jgi:hypothetical protein